MENNVVEYGPVHIEVSGKTSTERKMSVVDAGVTSITALALSNTKGKLGTAIRADMAERGLLATIHAAAQGNFRPLAEQLAIGLGTSIIIRTADEFSSVGYWLDRELDKVLASKSGGMTSAGKPTTAHAALRNAIELVAACYTARAEQKKRDAERRAAAAQSSDAAQAPALRAA